MIFESQSLLGSWNEIIIFNDNRFDLPFICYTGYVIVEYVKIGQIILQLSIIDLKLFINLSGKYSLLYQNYNNLLYQ